MSALIAGAGESTGAALAKLFAARGLAVHGARRRPPHRNEATAAFTPSAVDFRDEDAVNAFVSSVEESSGPIKLAVHNIGANVRFSVADTTPRVYQKTWELAALSALHFARAIGPRMAERGEGTMIFTGATASTRARRVLLRSARKARIGSIGARELGPRRARVPRRHRRANRHAIRAALIGDEAKYAALKAKGGLLGG